MNEKIPILYVYFIDRESPLYQAALFVDGSCEWISGPHENIDHLAQEVRKFLEEYLQDKATRVHISFSVSIDAIFTLQEVYRCCLLSERLQNSFFVALSKK
jgi:hypothetical protein